MNQAAKPKATRGVMNKWRKMFIKVNKLIMAQPGNKSNNYKSKENKVREQSNQHAVMAHLHIHKQLLTE